MRDLTINGKNYVLPTEKTTFADLKKVVKSIANARKIATKDLIIGLPDGRDVTFRELDLFKDMVVEMNVGVFIGASVDDNCAMAVKNLEYLTKKAYDTPVSFGQIATRSRTAFADIANNTHQRLVTNGEIAEDFVKLIAE